MKHITEQCAIFYAAQICCGLEGKRTVVKFYLLAIEKMSRGFNKRSISSIKIYTMRASCTVI
jgi:hypothetical protein